MRKIATLLVVGLLLMTSLMAFAGGSDENFVHTLPEEFVEPSEQVPSGGVTPRIDCNHTYGEERDHVFDQYACGKYVEYYVVSCRECGAFLRNEDTHYGTNNAHAGDWVESDSYYDFSEDAWFVDISCDVCGKVVGRRPIT